MRVRYLYLLSMLCLLITGQANADVVARLLLWIMMPARPVN